MTCIEVLNNLLFALILIHFLSDNREFFLMQDYLLCPHTTFHYVQALHGALSISASPKDYCSSSSSYSNISGTVSQNTSVQKRLSCESSSNNKSSTAVVMSSPDSCITLSTQVEGNDCELDLQVGVFIMVCIYILSHNIPM